MNLPANPDSSRSGLTLVEIVVATAIMAIFLLGMFSAMATSQKADVLTRERAAASEAAYSMLDTVYAGDFDFFSNNAVAFNVEFDTGRTTAQPFLTPATLAPVAAESWLGWTDAWTGMGLTAPGSVTAAGIATTRTGVGGNVDLMEIQVTVAWRSADNRNQRIDIVSRRLR